MSTLTASARHSIPDSRNNEQTKNSIIPTRPTEFASGVRRASVTSHPLPWPRSRRLRRQFREVSPFRVSIPERKSREIRYRNCRAYQTAITREHNWAVGTALFFRISPIPVTREQWRTFLPLPISEDFLGSMRGCCVQYLAHMILTPPGSQVYAATYSCLKWFLFHKDSLHYPFIRECRITQ